MKRVVGIGALLACLLLYFSAASAQNEYELTFGNYVVNYNTFPSTFLDKSIAKAAGVKRSDFQAVITIAVRQHVAGANDKPVKAVVSGNATNLIGQIRKLKLSEVKDGSAIYYIGDFTFVRGEQMTFNMTVTPEGEKEKQEFKFTRQF